MDLDDATQNGNANDTGNKKRRYGEYIMLNYTFYELIIHY